MLSNYALTAEGRCTPGVDSESFGLAGCCVSSECLALHAPFALVKTNIIKAALVECARVNAGDAVTEGTGRVVQQAAVGVCLVLNLLGEVTVGAGACAAVHTTGNFSHTPALTQFLYRLRHQTVLQQHVVSDVAVEVSTQSAHVTLVGVGHCHRHRRIPVVGHLQPKVCLNHSKETTPVDLHLV